MKVALQTVHSWSKDYTIGLRKFATRPSVGLPLWTNGYKWAKMNVSCNMIQDNEVSTTVEVCSQVAESKKRVTKDTFIVTESSSRAITSSQIAEESRADVEKTTVLSESLANVTANVAKPSSTNQRRNRKAVITRSSASQLTRLSVADNTQESLSQSQPSANEADNVAKLSSTNQIRKRKAVTSRSSSSKLTRLSVADNVQESLSQSQPSSNNSDKITKSTSSVPEDINLVNIDSFEKYKGIFSKWTVKISKTDALYMSVCNCPAYLKDYLCKHVIGLGIRLKLISVPSEAKVIPIGEKRKRGRPSKTKPALMLQ